MRITDWKVATTVGTVTYPGRACSIMGAYKRGETADGKRGGTDRHQNQTSHRAFSMNPRIQVASRVRLSSR